MGIFILGCTFVVLLEITKFLLSIIYKLIYEDEKKGNGYTIFWDHGGIM
jgi:hypothetical protein